MATAKQKIIARIRRWGTGSAFTPKDFLDLASRGSVDMALKVLADQGAIRRLGRGLYDLPREGRLVPGRSPADLDQVARAVARRFRWTIIPHGPLAANLWGLSTQVPARSVYISSGPSKKVAIGNRQIEFRHARPKETGVSSERAGAMIQAIRALGRHHVDDAVIGRIRDRLTAKDRRDLLVDARQSADWIYEVAQRIAGKGRR